MAKKTKSKKKKFPSAKAIVTYQKWANIFTGEIQKILTKINLYEKDLSEADIQLLAQFSYDYLEGAAQSPQKLLTQFILKKKNNFSSSSLARQIKEKKNSIFVTAIFPGLGHGGGLRVFDMIEEMAVRGHQIHLYSVPPRIDEGGALKDLKKIGVKVTIVDHQKMNLSEFHRWLAKQPAPFNSAYFVWPHSSPLMVNNENFIGHQVFEFIEVTTRRIWMDLVAYIQNCEFDKIPKKIEELWLCFQWEKIAVATAAELVCLTEKDAQFVQAVFDAKKTHLLTTGLSRRVMLNDLQKFSKVKVAPQSVGFIGNFEHYPNLDGIDWYLTHVHAEVLKKAPHYTFHIMGKGKFDQLKKKFSGFSKSVKWIGEIENVVESLKKVEICASPLINGAGLRGKVNQYAAVERPFVSTTIGVCGTPYENEKSALITDDPKQFADYIVALIQDQNKRLELTKNAKQVLEENFYWKNSIDALEKLL